MPERSIEQYFLTIQLISLLFPMLVLVYLINKWHRKGLIVMSMRLEEEVLKAQIELKETLLKNISEEIHDNVGQLLTLVKLTISTIRTNEDLTAEKLNDSKELLSKSIQELRNIAKNLDSDYYLQNGLAHTIKHELVIAERSGGIASEFEIIGSNVQLPAKKELIVFRIFQEALNNIIKHASATKLLVRITVVNKMFQLEIQDNGKGFNTQLISNEKSGLGLTNMANRAKLIGADFKFESAANKGTYLKLVLKNE
jgi:signal transduction histidine kinase